MTPLVDDDRLHIALDSQKLSTGQSCMRQYQYNFVLNLDPISKEEPMERGDLTHEMLKYYYRLRRHRSRWERNRRTHADIVQICIRIGRHAARRMGIGVDEIEFVIKAFTDYTAFVEHDGWDDEKIKAVEKTGSLILYQDDEIVIHYEVKMDLVIELQAGIEIAVDHKTAKSRRTYGLLSNQFMGYCWFLENNNIIINSIGFQKTLKPHERFVRQVLSYPTELISRWRCNTIEWVKQAIPQMQADQYLQNFTSCDKWSGCKYRDLCESESSVFPQKVQALYKIRESWDPGQTGI